MSKNQETEEDLVDTPISAGGLELKGLEAALWYAEHRSGANRSFFIFLLSISFLLSFFVLIAFSGQLISASPSADQSIQTILTNDLLLKSSEVLSPPQMKLERVAYLSQSDNITLLYLVQNLSPEYVLGFEAVFLDGERELGRKQYEIWPQSEKYVSWSGRDIGKGADLLLENQLWLRPSPRIYGDWQSFRQERLSPQISNKRIGSSIRLSQKESLETISFEIKNQSAYPLDGLNLQIPLFGRGDLVSYHEYHLGELDAGQSRLLTLSLPGNSRSFDDFEVWPDLLMPVNP